MRLFVLLRLNFITKEFDIDKGNTLSSYWPQRFEWSKFEETNIADLCLPDGGHLHAEDWTYLFLHLKAAPTAAPGSGGTGTKRPVKKVDPPRSLTASGSGGPASGASASVSLNTAAVAELGARTRADSLSPGSLSPRPANSPRKNLPLEQISEAESTEGQGNGGTTPGGNAAPAGPVNDLVYGLAMFLNKSDKNARRGAIQKSLLLVSRAPIFDLYQPILRHSLQHILESGDKNALKTLFETLQSAWGNKDINIFNHNFPYAASIANMKPDEFGSASLKELVQRFGVDTMYLWYTMLLRQRILFSGQPAHLVGECCLACPLLVAPLHGFARTISPYVALTDISPLERQHYICGITNSIMETHTHRYDMMASFSTGIVRKSNAKLSAMDKEFILNVISGMSAKGEKWVRDQFYNYTKNFLDSVANNTYKSAQHKALGEPFRLSELYESYVNNLKHASVTNPTQTGAAPAESLDSIVSTLLQASAGKLTLSDAKTKQLLWDLLQRLVDLNTIDELCERNILAVIAPMLDSNSAQVRKYAVATLAQIAISIKGQISLIQHNLIPRVVLMLRDPMPNVASAAAYCLYKISSLFIGVTALVQHRVPKMLLNIICSSEDNLTLKISTAETLLQIHRLDPTLPIVGHDNIRMMIRSTSDATFRNVLLLLLDLWGEARLPIKTTEEIEFHLASLRAGGLDVRTGSTSMLLSSVAQDRNLLLQIVAAGGIQTIIKNLVQTPREEPLARLSMAILCLAADTSMGRSSLIGYSAIPTVLAEFTATDFALHLYYAYRFCEVACQYPDTTEVFLEAHGLEQLVTAILKYAEKPSLQTLTMPCLGALKYLALLNPVLLHRHPELVQNFQPIAELFVRMVRRAYEQILSTSPHIIAPSLRRGSISSPTGSNTVIAPTVTASAAYEIVIGVSTRSPQEKDFYQLLQTVVSLWMPEALSMDLSGAAKTEATSPSKLANKSNSDTSDSAEVVVPIIDDELRSASEKLVNLLQNSSRPSTRARRGTTGSSMAAMTLDSINEADSEESLSRRASHVFDRGDDDDLIAAADSILADLELSTASPALSKQSSRTLLTPPASAKGTKPSTPRNTTVTTGTPGTPSSTLDGAIEAMDDDVDQLLADLASENIRVARSRSATETDLEISDVLHAIKEGDSGSSPSSSTGANVLSSTEDSSARGHARADSSGPATSMEPSSSTASLASNISTGYGSSLGGPVPGGSSSVRRPRWVPELNVGDMWDDIADLTSEILAEVPSAPSTPSTQGSSAHVTGELDKPVINHPTAPVRRSSDSFAFQPDSARSQRRSSLNLTSSGSFDIDKDRPGSARSGTSSPQLKGLRAPNSPRSSHSPAASPRSGSSPVESSILLSGAGSPRKKSSPRISDDAISGNVSPKREKDRERSTSHSRKTSGGASLRSHSPTRTSKTESGSIDEQSGSAELYHLDSPGRKKSRRSIQIIAPHNSLLDDTAHPPVLSASQPAIDAPSSGSSGLISPKDSTTPHSPRREKKRRSSEFEALSVTSESSTSSKKEHRKSKRLSSDMEGLSIVVPPTSVGTSAASPSGSNPVTPTDSPDLKKLKRKSSTKNAKEKDVIKKDPTSARGEKESLKESKEIAKEKKDKDKTTKSK